MRPNKCIMNKRTISSHPYFPNKTNINKFSVRKNSKNLNENLDIKVLILNATQETKSSLLKDKEQLNFLKTSKSLQNIIEESLRSLKEEPHQQISSLQTKSLKWDNKLLKNTSNKDINWKKSWSLSYMTTSSIELRKRLISCNKTPRQSIKQSSETDNLRLRKDIIRELTRLDMDPIWSLKLCLMKNSN